MDHASRVREIETEMRVIEVRRQLHFIGFPADDLEDEVLAGSMVMVRRNERWEVVEGYRVVSMIESTEYDRGPDRILENRYGTVLLRGYRPSVLAWPPGIPHVFAFDEWGFYLGHLRTYDIHPRFLPGPGEDIVDMEMRSVGHYMIGEWGVRPG